MINSEFLPTLIGKFIAGDRPGPAALSILGMKAGMRRLAGLSMMRLSVFVCLGLAGPVAAQQAVPCNGPAHAANIVEPWQGNTRTFANGDVRLALLDTVEPAAGAYHILILSPPLDISGDRQCRTLGLSEGFGFSDADFSSLKAGFDPETGLVFDMGVQIFEGSGYRSVTLHFTLNLASGKIDATLR